MSFHEYPKVKYHPKHDPRTVNHRDAEDELGEDWYDTPDEAKGAASQSSSENEANGEAQQAELPPKSKSEQKRRKALQAQE
jgi:hypothetical protein